MSNMLQLKYDELNSIVKGFKDSGEDITLLHAKTRDRVHGLYGQWIGEAADKFYADMEEKHLPSLGRVGQVLFTMQDVLLKVIKLINETDLETVGYFRQDFDQLGGISVGVGTFTEGGVGQFQQGAGSAGTVDTGSLDQAGGSQQGQQENSSGSGSQNSAQEMGSGGGGGGGSSGGSGGGGTSGAGGSYGSSSSGGGVGSAGSSSSGAQGMPDHFYGGGGGEGSSGGSGSASSGSTGGGEQGSAGGGAAAAAAAVGVGGAALGGAAKAARGRKK